MNAATPSALRGWRLGASAASPGGEVGDCGLSSQGEWADKERQLRAAVAELHEEAQAEAQRRAARREDLALILPPHVLLLLTRGEAHRCPQSGGSAAMGSHRVCCFVVTQHLIEQLR